MPKARRKLTAAEKARKKKRRQEYMTIFINGKQKQVRRPTTIEGTDVDEFIRINADPIWLHQNEMWEEMEPIPESGGSRDPDSDSTRQEDVAADRPRSAGPKGDQDIPF